MNQQDQPTSPSQAAANHSRWSDQWLGKLLVDFVDGHAETSPDKSAIVSDSGNLSYGDLRAQTRNLAAAFIDLGVDGGDVVAIQAPSWPELVVCHFALDRIGAIFLPLNEGFRDTELQHLLTLSAARIFIYPAMYRGFDYRALTNRLRPALPDLRQHVVLRGSPEGNELGFDALVQGDARITKERLAAVAGRRPASSSPLHIMASSGTTAMPRCTIYCDDATSYKLVRQYGEFGCHLRADDIAAAIAPVSTGATGYSFPVLAPLLHGGTSVLLEHWNGQAPEKALALMAEHRCSYAVMMPTQLIKLLSVPDIEAYDLSALRFISNAGAKLPEAVAAEAERRFGCVIQTMYGASDAGVATMTSIDDPAQNRRTAGRPAPGQQLRVIDDSGREVAANEDGEVCWRGPNQSLGYLNDPEESATVWDAEGWYHSGDIGVVDDDGYLTIVGRKKDMIIRGGHNINPGQIEEVLMRHAKIADAVVIPIQHDVLGEIACAVVVGASLKDPPGLDELNQFILAAGLAVWCQPERLLVIDDLPRNAGGKVDKRALAADLAARAFT